MQKIFLVFVLSFLATGSASAQAWRTSLKSHPITDAPIAVATANAGGDIYGWDFIAWCGNTDHRGMRWQLRIDTNDVIDSNAYSYPVTFRFDKNSPKTVSADLGGDYSNSVFLVDSEDETLAQLTEFTDQLKSSSSLAVQIGNTTRVFSLAGSTAAFTRWSNHCKLTELE